MLHLTNQKLGEAKLRPVSFDVFAWRMKAALGSFRAYRLGKFGVFHILSFICGAYANITNAVFLLDDGRQLRHTY